MNNSSLLNQEIVKARQEKAPRLENMLREADSLSNVLQQVVHSPLVRNKPQQGESLIARLTELREQLSNKLSLFKNGLITVSVAGVEKSGKTTMLKNLTGIEHLPTDDQRCTSVSCEILYASSPAEEGLDIIYYTREELLGVIRRQLSYLRNASDLWEDGKQCSLPETVDSVEAFLGCRLPYIADISAIKRILYGSALQQLWAIQDAISKYATRLGTTGHDSLAGLSQYASHQTANNKVVSDLQPIIRKISIHKQFEGGSPCLRFCDTPGVDDPNPQAFEHTLHAIKAETDLLVIANRPGNTPSITQPLGVFLSNLKRLDVSSPLRERSIFFVNWHKCVDPDMRNANIRIQEINREKVFPPSSIYGPCDVMDSAALSQFMVDVNSRLRNDIPRQDNELIQNFTREWKSVQAIARQILDELRNQAPPMPASLQRELDAKFDMWFDKQYESGSERSETEYFMGALVTRMNEKTQQCRNHKELQNLAARVKAIYDAHEKQLKEWLNTEATAEKCRTTIDSGNCPNRNILPKLGAKMTAFVQEMAAVAEDIAPVIQEEVYDVIAQALGNEIAAQLCPGNTACEKLSTLSHKLEESGRDTDVLFIAKSLKEISDISMQMRCIMRHELRPALNLFDRLRWINNRRDVLVEEVSKKIQPEPCKKWLKEAKLCSAGQNTPDEFSMFYKKLVASGFEVVKCVLSHQSSKLAELMEDFMGDACQTLATQDKCQNGWRKGLMPYGNIILAAEWREQAARQESAEQFKALVDSLESVLP